MFWNSEKVSVTLQLDTHDLIPMSIARDVSQWLRHLENGIECVKNCSYSREFIWEKLLCRNIKTSYDPPMWDNVAFFKTDRHSVENIMNTIITRRSLREGPPTLSLFEDDPSDRKSRSNFMLQYISSNETVSESGISFKLIFYQSQVSYFFLRGIRKPKTGFAF